MTAPCQRCSSPLEDGDLRCAVCARVCVAVASTATAERARILRCDACNAAVAFAAEVQAPRCAFCGAVMHVEQPVDPVERAELGLPFRVEREAAKAALRAWLGRKGWFYPRDLVSGAAIDSIAPLHWAAWVVEATALVSWTADSDLGSHRSSWAPHSGQVQMRFDGTLVPASRGLTLAECHELTPRYDLSSAVPVAQVPPVGGVEPVIEAFDAQRSAARRAVVAAIEATAASRLTQGTIPGSRFRNVKVGVLLQGMRTHRVAMPAWVLAYRYKDTPYRAVVHGQDGERVRGEAPLDMVKVAAVTLVVLGLIALLLFALAR